VKRPQACRNPKSPGRFGAAGARCDKPSVKYSFLGIASLFFVLGIIFWGGFNTGMEATNKLEFCISCHEMRDNVYQEYKKTIHYSNRTGVRAICSDCHVPHEWTHKADPQEQGFARNVGKAHRADRHPREIRGQPDAPGERRVGAHGGQRLARMPQLPQF
jgi:hypothetical protein